MATITGYTKAGTDAKAAPLSTTAPLAPGVATAGTSGAAARADHVHPITMPSYPLGAGRVMPLGGSDSASPVTLSLTLAACTPIPIYRPTKITALGILLGAYVADAGTIEVAIYSPATSGGLPSGAPVWTASVSGATSDPAKALPNLNLTLQPGVHFLAAFAKGATTLPKTWGPESPVIGNSLLPHFGNDIDKKGMWLKLASGAWPTSGHAYEYLDVPSTFYYSMAATAV